MEQNSLSLRSLMRGNVLVLTVSRLLWSVSGSIVQAYASLFILSLGGSAPIIGLITSLGTLAASILYPVGGYIADKAGRAKLVGVSTVLYVLAFLFMALVPSWEWYAIAFVYQQIVMFYTPALNAIMADSIPVGARGRVYALTVAIPEAMRILVPYIGGYMIAVYALDPAMRIGYAMGFLIGLVVIFIRLRYLKETIKDREPIGHNIPRIMKQSYKDVLTSTKWLFTNLRGYTIVSNLLAVTSSIVMPFWVVYAQKVIGLSPYMWGVVLLIAGIVKTLGSLVIGNVVDRLGPKICMILAIILAIPSTYAFTIASSFIQLLPIYITLVVSSSFMWIASSVYGADNVPRSNRGRIMAAIGQGSSIGITGGGYTSGFLQFIPMSIGSLVGGLIYDINPALPWIIQSACLVLGLILGVAMIKETQKKQE